MNIYESAENYLEAILSLHERHGLVRSIDIANELHFSKPSVSVAMKKLRESGYIEMDKDGFISLLPSGEEIARRIYERHKLLTQFFIRLGVDPEVAAADACKVEHDLSEETFQKMKEHALGGQLPEMEGSDRQTIKRPVTRVTGRFVCTYTAASAPPSARQLSAAASSGASLQITGSETRLQPALSQSSAQVRIHSPSPQP